MFSEHRLNALSFIDLPCNLTSFYGASIDAGS